MLSEISIHAPPIVLGLFAGFLLYGLLRNRVRTQYVLSVGKVIVGSLAGLSIFGLLGQELILDNLARLCRSFEVIGQPLRGWWGPICLHSRALLDFVAGPDAPIVEMLGVGIPKLLLSSGFIRGGEFSLAATALGFSLAMVRSVGTEKATEDVPRTDPRHHDPNCFCYIVKTYLPLDWRTKKVISASAISHFHTRTFHDGGVILRVPNQNILVRFGREAVTGMYKDLESVPMIITRAVEHWGVPVFKTIQELLVLGEPEHYNDILISNDENVEVIGFIEGQQPCYQMLWLTEDHREGLPRIVLPTPEEVASMREQVMCMEEVKQGDPEALRKLFTTPSGGEAASIEVEVDENGKISSDDAFMLSLLAVEELQESLGANLLVVNLIGGTNLKERTGDVDLVVVVREKTELPKFDLGVNIHLIVYTWEDIKNALRGRIRGRYGFFRNAFLGGKTTLYGREVALAIQNAIGTKQKEIVLENEKNPLLGGMAASALAVGMDEEKIWLGDDDGGAKEQPEVDSINLKETLLVPVAIERDYQPDLPEIEGFFSRDEDGQLWASVIRDPRLDLELSIHMRSTHGIPTLKSLSEGAWSLVVKGVGCPGRLSWMYVSKFSAALLHRFARINLKFGDNFIGAAKRIFMSRAAVLAQRLRASYIEGRQNGDPILLLGNDSEAPFMRPRYLLRPEKLPFLTKDGMHLMSAQKVLKEFGIPRKIRRQQIILVYEVPIPIRLSIGEELSSPQIQRQIAAAYGYPDRELLDPDIAQEIFMTFARRIAVEIHLMHNYLHGAFSKKHTANMFRTGNITMTGHMVDLDGVYVPRFSLLVRLLGRFMAVRKLQEDDIIVAKGVIKDMAEFLKVDPQEGLQRFDQFLTLGWSFIRTPSGGLVRQRFSETVETVQTELIKLIDSDANAQEANALTRLADEFRLDAELHDFNGSLTPRGFCKVARFVFNNYSGFSGLVDARPVNSGLLAVAFVGHDMAVKEKVNPNSMPLVGIYGGAAVDVSNFLLSTNATEGYFVDYNYGVEIPEAASVKEYLARKYVDGYGGDNLLQGLYFEALIAELRATGVSEDEIREIETKRDKYYHDGNFTISFHWAYPGEEPKLRVIQFIKGFITGESIDNDPLDGILSKGIDFYYQRAGLYLPGKYETFIDKIATSLNPEGFLILDNECAIVNWGENSYDPLDYIESVDMIPVVPNSQMLSWQDFIRKHFGTKGDARRDYGWNVKIYQKADPRLGGRSPQLRQQQRKQKFKQKALDDLVFYLGFLIDSLELSHSQKDRLMQILEEREHKADPLSRFNFVEKLPGTRFADYCYDTGEIRVLSGLTRREKRKASTHDMLHALFPYRYFYFGGIRIIESVFHHCIIDYLSETIIALSENRQPDYIRETAKATSDEDILGSQLYEYLIHLIVEEIGLTPIIHFLITGEADLISSYLDEDVFDSVKRKIGDNFKQCSRLMQSIDYIEGVDIPQLKISDRETPRDFSEYPFIPKLEETALEGEDNRIAYTGGRVAQLQQQETQNRIRNPKEKIIILGQETTLEEIGLKLKAVRRTQHDWGRARFAPRLGMDEDVLRRIERGVYPQGLTVEEVILRLIDVCDISLKDFWATEPAKKRARRRKDAEVPYEIVELLKVKMSERGIKQIQIARNLGVSRQRVNYWFTHKEPMFYPDLLRVVNIGMGIESLEDLFGEEVWARLQEGSSVEDLFQDESADELKLDEAALEAETEEIVSDSAAEAEAAAPESEFEEAETASDSDITGADEVLSDTEVEEVEEEVKIDTEPEGDVEVVLVEEEVDEGEPEIPIPSDIGPKWKAVRLDKGWIQGKVKESTGIPQSRVSQIERGEKQPTLSECEKMAGVSGLTLEGLFHYKSKPKVPVVRVLKSSKAKPVKPRKVVLEDGSKVVIPVGLWLIIKFARHVEGLNQIQLEDKAGVPRGTISDIEKRKRDTTVPKLKKVVAALDLDLVDLSDYWSNFAREYSGLDPFEQVDILISVSGVLQELIDTDVLIGLTVGISEELAIKLKVFRYNCGYGNPKDFEIASKAPEGMIEKIEAGKIESIHVFVLHNIIYSQGLTLDKFFERPEDILLHFNLRRGIKQARENAGKTHKKVDQAMGWKSGTTERIELLSEGVHFIKVMPYSELLALAEFLDVTFDQLYRNDIPVKQDTDLGGVGKSPITFVEAGSVDAEVEIAGNLLIASSLDEEALRIQRANERLIELAVEWPGKIQRIIFDMSEAEETQEQMAGYMNSDEGDALMYEVADQIIERLSEHDEDGAEDLPELPGVSSDIVFRIAGVFPLSIEEAAKNLEEILRHKKLGQEHFVDWVCQEWSDRDLTEEALLDLWDILMEEEKDNGFDCPGNGEEELNDSEHDEEYEQESIRE